MHPGTWVEASPFRALVRYLSSSTALSWRAIALHAGVPPRVIDALLHGRQGRPLRRLPPDIARRLLALRAESLDALSRQAVPVAETASTLCALRHRGWTNRTIAGICRLDPGEIEALAGAARGFTTRRTALVIAAAAEGLGLAEGCAGDISAGQDWLPSVDEPSATILSA